jgi:hypothetical protein
MYGNTVAGERRNMDDIFTPAAAIFARCSRRATYGPAMDLVALLIGIVSFAALLVTIELLDRI